MSIIDNTVSFTGHRPHKLGGYDMDENNLSIIDPKNKIIEGIAAKTEETVIDLIGKGYDRFISGGALGFDITAFYVVNKVKQRFPHVKNIVAIPFELQYIKWSPAYVYRYNQMLSLADEKIYVDLLSNYMDKSVDIGAFSVLKMMQRNKYMVDNSSIVIACWDGTSGGTANCVGYAKRSLTWLRG